MIALLEQLARERFWNFQLEITPNAHLIAADVHWAGYGEIEVCVDPDAEKAFYGHGFSDDEQGLLARGVVEHAYGHLNRCPGNNARPRFAIMEAVAEVVEAHRSKSTIEEKETAIAFYADLAADILLDAALVADDREGWYADAALLYYKCKVLTTQGMSLAQHFIIRMGLELFGNGSAYYASLLDLLNSHASADEQQKLTAMVRQAKAHIAALADDEGVIDVVRHPQHWPSLAGKFTELFLDAKSANTRRSSRKSKTSEDAEQIDTARGNGGGSLTPSSFPNLLTQWYADRASEVSLSLSQGADGMEQLPVSPLVVRPVDESRMPPLSEINWPRTLLFPHKNNEESSRLQLYWNEHYVTVPVPSASMSSSMPDISFWVDSSESMTYEPFQKQGRYDLLLRALFGVFRWIETQTYAPYLNYSALNFSAETKYSGWKSWQNRQDIYNLLFDHQNGRTTLDITIFEKLIREASRPFIVVMVTDGELKNWKAVSSRIIGRFDLSKNFILIQIGNVSKLFTTLREKGFPTHVIENAEGLNSLVLGEIVARYK